MVGHDPLHLTVFTTDSKPVQPQECQGFVYLLSPGQPLWSATSHMGNEGLEPPTSRMSSVRSIQLS